MHEDGSEYPGDAHPVMVTLKTGMPVENAVMGVFIPELDEYRWININSIPRFNNGKLFQVVVTFEDITKLTNAKEQAKESYELLKNLAAQVPGVVYQYRLYPDGRSSFPYSSPGMYEIYEVTPEEVRDDASLVFTRIHPDDYSHIVETIRESSLRLTEYRSEFRVVLPEKGLRWRSCHAMPERLADGSTLWHGVIMDITDRKKIEEALKASEEFQRALVACSPVALYSLDLDGRVLSWNESAERIFGWTAEEVLGDIPALIPENCRDEYRENLALVQKGGMILGKEFTRRRKDGSLIPISLSVAPILDDKGTLVGIMAAAEDISERKRVESELQKHHQHLETMVKERTAALQEVNSELEAFTYSVSHDLRAPLRAINGFSQYLELDYMESLGDEGKRYIGIIRDNAEKMDRLITDLLEFSRLSRTELNSVDINMKAMAVSMFLEVTTEEEKNAFDFVCPDIPSVKGDPTAIKQVWSNLLGNAVKYSSRSEVKRIEIGFRDEGDRLTYFVQDQGSGFDPRYKDKLFGVFQRLHKDSEFKGTGVGLAIVKRIIERHNGSVWADGSPGKGAVFYFSLPKL